MFRSQRLISTSIRRLQSTNQAAIIKQYAETPISVGSIKDIATRWERMPTAEQNLITAKLKARQTQPWKELSVLEQQAAYYVSYGAWGPRKPEFEEGDIGKVTLGVLGGFSVAAVIFYLFTNFVANPKPASTSVEWQLAADEYLKSKNANPWGGYSQLDQTGLTK
ncbi:related to Cytochrome c oxidase polypeptide 5B, mitochondrial [Hanseniaspora guilliermondii]|uniref:Related to Cytochrome c oxidase polypeptide 5B, mitochondrial n=1 Tax=Hanseniaspora guilliermondii TaxID=56406 RepID=A0A1L0CTF1_9ASCO|nr:related to Cytochrome c oxidase polypeptide 5B, mitochondrial [Hanseniaspora guilliermondii]